MTTRFREYHKLRLAEETLGNLRSAIRLAEKEAGFDAERLIGVASSVDSVGADSAESWLAIVRDSVPGRLDRLHTLEVARAIGRRKARLHETARSSAAALVVYPVVAMHATFPESRGNRLLDFCYLVFHQAYFALLPELTDEIWAAHRTSLNDGIDTLAERMPRASDRFHILALQSEWLGRQDLAGEYYREVVQSTPADAHEFMTVLQQCWAHCLEQHRYDAALETLLDAYPRICRKDLDEMRELMQMTFDLARRRPTADQSVPGAPS